MQRTIEQRGTDRFDLGSLQDWAEIRVIPGFAPVVTMKRWQGERSIDLELKLLLPNASLLESSTKIIYGNGDVSVCLYEAERKIVYVSGIPFDQHELGGLEYEVIFGTRPAFNHIDFNINAPGLNFYFQPLSMPSSENRCCPENVRGSYAVYHDVQENRMHSSKAEGDKYRSGKAFHIYRPKLIDALGRESWANIVIDTKRGLLRIILDPFWMDNAVYPVVLDPDFGYMGIGGSNGAVGTNTIYASGMAAPADGDGTTDTMSIYSLHAVGAVDAYVGLYVDTAGPAAIVAGSPKSNLAAGTWGASWKAFTMAGLSVTNGVDYWNTAQFDVDNVNQYWDTPGGTNRYWDTGEAEGVWNATFEQDSSSAAKYSMYTTYTPTGGGAGVPGNVGARAASMIFKKVNDLFVPEYVPAFDRLLLARR